MKKVFITIAAIALFGLNSCKNCVDCSGSAAYSGYGDNYCKDDYEASVGSSLVPWSTFRTTLTSGGCK